MDLERLFPDITDIAANIEPLDDRVLLQIQCAPKTSSSIVLIDSVKEAEQFQRTLCKVINVGSNAFYSKATGRKWVDVNIGDYVIAPRTSGQRLLVEHPNKDELPIHLLLVEDVSVFVKINNPVDYLKNLVSKDGK